MATAKTHGMTKTRAHIQHQAGTESVSWLHSWRTQTRNESSSIKPLQRAWSEHQKSSRGESIVILTRGKNVNDPSRSDWLGVGIYCTARGGGGEGTGVWNYLVTRWLGTEGTGRNGPDQGKWRQKSEKRSQEKLIIIQPQHLHLIAVSVEMLLSWYSKK